MTPKKPHEPFIYPITVRFGDVDPAGVVYHPVFMHYFHVSLEEFLSRAVKIPYPDLLKKHKIGLPTVRTEATFTGPVRYGDQITIRVWVSRLGGASVVFEFEARKGGDPCARGTLTKVVLDLGDWKPIMIPEDVRKALQKFHEAP